MLILTHIIVRDEFGEATRTIQDKIELDEWAEKLGIEKAPIIFQGKLNDDQKMSIMDFLSTPLMDLKNRFKTESFSKYSQYNKKISAEILNEIAKIKTTQDILYFIAGHVNSSYQQRQVILNERDLKNKFYKLLEIINTEIKLV